MLTWENKVFTRENESIIQMFLCEELEIYVFWMNIDGIRPDIDYSWLHPEKKTEIQRYRRKEDRLLHLGGELLLVYGLQTLFRKDYGDCSLKQMSCLERIKGKNGKPYLKFRSDIFYNISHSGNYVVCAFSTNEVGIDIEAEKELQLDIARRFYHPDEFSEIVQTDPEEQSELFYRIWVMKESYLKATGTGLSVPLNSFKYRKCDGKIYVYTDDMRMPYQVCTLDLIEGYKLAICKRIE